MALLERRPGFLGRGKSGQRRAEDIPDLEGVDVLSSADARQLFSDRAKADLGMTGEEFERAWNQGKFAGREEDPAVRRVAMLRPSKRR